MHILEQLYIGNVRPGERSFKRNSQYARALAAVADAEEAVLATLNEEQKKFFEAFVDAQREVAVLTDAETFIYSFRLGGKIRPGYSGKRRNERDLKTRYGYAI